MSYSNLSLERRDAAVVITLDQQLAPEAELQARAAASGDAAEEIAAFSEKRAPRFRGR